MTDLTVGLFRGNTHFHFGIVGVPGVRTYHTIIELEGGRTYVRTYQPKVREGYLLPPAKMFWQMHLGRAYPYLPPGAPSCSSISGLDAYFLPKLGTFQELVQDFP